MGLAGHIGAATTPLRVAIGDPPAMEDLLGRLGIGSPLTNEAHAAIAALLDVADPLDDIADALVELADRDADHIAAAAAIVDAAIRVADAIAQLASVEQNDLLELPPPLDDPDTWTDLAAELAVELLTAYLRDHLPGLFGALAITGVLAPPTSPRSPQDQRLEVRLDRLVDLVTDPAARLAEQFGWDDSLDWQTLTWWLIEIARAHHIRAEIVELPEPIVDDVYDGDRPFFHGALGIDLVETNVASVGHAALGFLTAPLGPLDEPAGEPVGFYVAPTLWGSAAGSVDLGGGWWLDIAVGVDASGLSGLSFRPGQVAHETSGPAPNGSLALRYEPDHPMTVLGGEVVQLLLHGVRVGVSVDDALVPTVDVAATGAGLELRIGASEADSFIGAMLGALDIDAKLPAGITAGSGGIEIEGGVGLAISRTLDQQLGPFTIRTIEAELGIAIGGIGIQLEGILGVDATLGPFTASVGGIGARLELVESRTDDLDVGLGLALHGGFVPPDRVGFEIEAEGVTGGGFVYVEDDRYVGGLTLDIVEVGVDALVVVDTSLPSDPDGFALFASLSLRFPGIPLGFGFSLTGLGGLLALNRGVDAEALAVGLRDGAADAVMFPEDIVRDADVLVTSLDDYFPVQQGNTVIGPLAELTWGASGMVTGQLGIVVSLPQGVILVLGSLEAILPDEAAPVLELHLDTLGTIDLAEGTVLVVASLYDSRLLGTIELSGDAALYVSVLHDPYFVLSVGGFHPGFEPPGHAPSILENLRRMRAEVVIGLGVTATVEAYFAVTSNTVQFGGAFEIEASADFLLVSYTARGWFDFDVLIQFTPFLIIADASAGVGVYANDKELLGVDLSVHLEGPQPWYASGTARFTFFGVKVKFDFAVGGHAAPEIAASSDVLDLMLLELLSPAAWTVRHANGISAGLQLAGDESDALVRPDDVIIVRQTVAPLGYRLDKYGEDNVDQREVNVASVSIVDRGAGVDIGGIEVDDHNDWFAPAQYTTMRDTDRLSAPSYELLQAGVSIGADGVGVPSEDPLEVPAGHETEIWDPVGGYTVALGEVAVNQALDDLIHASAGGRTATIGRGVRVEGTRVSIDGERYVVVDGRSGTVTTRALSYVDAVREASASQRVVPAGGVR